MIQAATFEAIENAAKMFATQPGPKPEPNGRFNVQAYLDHYGITYKVKGNGEKTIYALDHCVFNSAHVNNDACILQFADGKLGYKCHHDSCMGKGWQDARQAISGSDNLRRFMPGTHEKRDIELDPDLVVYTMSDIVGMPDQEEDPLIEGLLEKGDSLLITGQGGLGKSLVIDSLSLSVAAGKKVFDAFDVKGKHPVLLIQSENSRKATKKRRLALIEKYRSRVDFEDYVAGMNMVFTLMRGTDCRISGDIMSEAFSKILAETLEATKAELLILDPLISYHRKSENDNVAMRETLDRLSEITGPKTAIILTHHHGKGDYTGANQSRGATAILDWARGVITLNPQKHETKELIKASHTKSGNFKRAKDFLLEIDGPCVMPVEPDILCPPSKVVQILKDIGGTAHSKNELVTAVCEVCDVVRKTAQDAIDRTQDMGFIRSWKQGNAFQYGVV